MVLQMRELMKLRWLAKVQRYSEPYFCFNFGSLGGLLPLQSQQSMPNHVQIGQRAGAEQAIGVFLQAAVAHLGETKDAFNDQERMLDFGTHPRLRGVLRFLGW